MRLPVIGDAAGFEHMAYHRAAACGHSLRVMRCWSPEPPATSAGRLAPRLLDAGPPGALPVPQRRPAARRALGRPGRDRRGRPDRPGDAAGRVRRRRRRLLPGALARPAGLRGARPGRRPRNFAAAARAAGVRRIVYLGGPEPPPGEQPSPHLRSRAEVARILLDSGVPTVVLRAPVIIGSGSASFEMLRYLTERLPVMVTPRWVTQPDPADRGPRRAALPDRRGRRCRPRSTAASTSAAPTCSPTPR